MSERSIDVSDWPNSNRLYIYLSGGIPSFRELQLITSFVEVHLVWAGMALLRERMDELQGDRTSYSPEDPWRKEYSAIERERLAPLNDSYTSYLRRKYLPAVTEGIAGNQYGKIYSDKERPWHRENLDDWFRYQFMSEKRIGGGETDFDDFNGWISSELGLRLFPALELSTSNSFEALIDISIVAAMVAFQDAPLAIDICTYAVNRIKEIITDVTQPRRRSFVPPKLTPSHLKFLGQYDDIEFEYDGTREAYKVVLRRDVSK